MDEEDEGESRVSLVAEAVMGWMTMDLASGATWSPIDC
jgi:hypothetical protein